MNTKKLYLDQAGLIALIKCIKQYIAAGGGSASNFVLKLLGKDLVLMSGSTEVSKITLPQEPAYALSIQDNVITLTKDNNTLSQINCNQFAVDGMLKDVALVDNMLEFDFNSDAGSKKIRVDMSKLASTYTAGANITITDHVISADVDVAAEDVSLASTDENLSETTNVKEALETLSTKLGDENWYIYEGGDLPAFSGGKFRGTYVDLMKYATNIDDVKLFKGCVTLTTVTIHPQTEISDGSSFFENCYSLTVVQGGRINGSAVSMFYNCVSLAYYYFPIILDTVTSTSSMFINCRSLGCADLTAASDSIKTANFMFYNCTSLRTVCAGNAFDNVTAGSGMFSNCTSLTTLSLSSGSFSKLTGAENMFYGCESLTTCILEATFHADIDLKFCTLLSAKSLYSWVSNLYDFTNDPEGLNSSATTHTITLTTDQVSRLQDYTGEGGESGADAYQTALDRGWTIANS